MTKNDRLIQELQCSMIKSTKGALSLEEIDAIRCLVRIVCRMKVFLESLSEVEWNRQYSCDEDANHTDEFHETLAYHADTVLSGLDSFRMVAQLYRCLGNSRGSKLAVACSDINVFKEHYCDLFDEFVGQTRFASKCEFILLLYRMGLVFSAITCT